MKGIQYQSGSAGRVTGGINGILRPELFEKIRSFKTLNSQRGYSAPTGPSKRKSGQMSRKAGSSTATFLQSKTRDSPKKVIIYQHPRPSGPDCPAGSDRPASLDRRPIGPRDDLLFRISDAS
jgi:hypothetical protein